MTSDESSSPNPPETDGESDSATETPWKTLTFEESRVLGCLLEKEMTTPEYYPLTSNALLTACNQSSNREPVVSFDARTVEDAMDSLRYKGYAIRVHQAGARVPKNKHRLSDVFPYLREGERAVLCVMFLRGPQTLGELRQRTERMHSFADMDAVQRSVDSLIQNDPAPLAKEIPAGGGRRVPTYAHLLCGDVALPVSPVEMTGTANPPVEPSWRETVEEELAELRAEIAGLRTQLETLRSELGN